MFGHPHYVPILRWKLGEALALSDVRSEDRSNITPLVELVPRDFAPNKDRKPRVPEVVIEQKAELLANCWGNEPFFLDLGLLDGRVRASKRAHLLVVTSREAQEFGLSIVPVTGLRRTTSYQRAMAAVVKATGLGACLRLAAAEIQRAGLDLRIRDLLSNLSLRRNQVDLHVDCGFVQGSPLDIESICAKLSNLNRWRSFTVASGAFPKDLTGFSVGEHELPRLDWCSWRDLMLGSTKLKRRPSFADYTIQHPIFVEPPDQPRYSASIRYTSDDYWVIMRGESVFKDDGPGMAQWPANAQMLCERPEFMGAQFSDGDRYIEEMSEQTEKTGNARTWIQAGINHHLTFVARQIASFFGVSVVGAL
jgi:hypothetical protein